MYFANNQCVLEFDGTNWEQYYLNNIAAVKSLATDSLGIVYVGGDKEFGCLKPNKTGKLTYISFSDKLKDKKIEFSPIWKIVVSKQGVYFFTFNKIFWWNNNEIIPFSATLAPFFGFNINDNIYVRTSTDICLLKDTILTPIKENIIEELGTGYLRIMDYSDNKLLFATSKNGLLIYDLTNKTIEKLESEVNNYLIENILYSSTRIDENRIALGTSYGGILVVNNQGKLLQVINEKRGLSSNSVFDLFADNNKNLWSVGQKGISQTNINYPITKFGKQQNIDSYVLDAIIYNSRKYVAAYDGLYYLPDYKLSIKDDNHAYKKFVNTYTIWDLKIINNNLFAAGKNGLMQISDTTQRNIFPAKTFVKIAYSSKMPNYIFIGALRAFVAIEVEWNKNGKFIKTKSHKIIPEVTEQITDIITDDNNNFWIIASNTIYFVRIDSIDNYTVTKFSDKSGLTNERDYRITKVDKKINILTEKGVYKPVFPESHLPDSLIKFVHDETWGDYFTKDSNYIANIVELKPNTYFIHGSPSAILYKQENGEIKLDTNYLKILSIINPSYTMIDNKKNINLGTPNSLWVFNPLKKKHTQEPYNCLFRKIYINSDSLIFEGTFYNKIDSQKILSTVQPETFMPTLDYENNSISFLYSAIYFDNIEQITYQFKLEGYESEWSKPTNETKANYTNLKEGRYIFKVKASNIYGIESEIATYEFSILPPWYRTWWAYTGYVLLLGLLFFIFVKLALRRVIKAKIRLEKIVKERTFEILQQKEEILSQNEEILTQNEILNQKNEEIQTQANNLQNANDEITLQKDKIEDSHSSITASITYARRIQTAMLPFEQEFEDFFSEYFIFFKPRDIISGDFYYFKKIKEYIIFAVADCTGHGVPGAFVSMLGISLLNEITQKKEITQANQVLDQLRNDVKNSLRQTGKIHESKDGMDIALSVLNKNTNELQYAGAYNPLYIIKREELRVKKEELRVKNEKPKAKNQKPSLTIIKADRQPIGIHIKEKPFTNNTFQLKKNDVLYMFTDGFADQNGGNKNLKYMMKKFKNLLLSNSDKPLTKQKQILETELDNWQGEEEQRDDITVMGIKI